MLFNSGVFLKFFTAFFLVYWLVRDHLSWRNGLIVAGSYLFYGWWDYRFLSLILISTLLDYYLGLALGERRRPGQRRFLLFLSMAGNLIILGFFKYYDFFAGSMAELMDGLGLSFHPATLGIVLPVGISFYTFQTMSYTIDIYRGEMRPTRNLVAFMAYVSFFPQLVAGPIERARHLLPQFERTLTITRPMVEEGLWLMVWGMFTKVVLADNLAPLADLVYSGTNYSAIAVVLATVAFGLQIYCDFSAYSNIARGLALLLGFDIMVNFDIPYSATSVREFWHRWHISLSTWLRDYLYISLGGNRLGSFRTTVNLLLTMLLGGLWHGAAWNFVLWGAFHGMGLTVNRWVGERRSGSRPHRKSGLKSSVCWLGTMAFVFYGWLLFRARSMDQIMAMTQALGNGTVPPWIRSYLLNLAVFASPLLMMEIWQRRTRNRLAALALPWWGRGIVQGLLLAFVILYWEKASTPFIYFRF
jgi:alginate O-acetyltransferase complex protein AlgI